MIFFVLFCVFAGARVVLTVAHTDAHTWPQLNDDVTSAFIADAWWFAIVCGGDNDDDDDDSDAGSQLF